MLESVLFLGAGILFIMIALALVINEIDVIADFMLSISVFLVTYTILSSILIAIGQFSVNRSLMLIMGFSLVLMLAVMLIRRKCKPLWTLNLHPQIFTLILCVVFAVAGIGVIANGFFDMDTVLGVSQMKAMNLASKNDISPFEAEYLQLLSEDSYAAVSAMTEELEQTYNGYSRPLTAVLALGSYFFGYMNMFAILIIAGICFIYVISMLINGCVLKSRHISFKPVLINIIMTVITALLIMAVSSGLGENSVKNSIQKARTVKSIDKIVSDYDIVIIDEDIIADLYIPVYATTCAKVYPLYSELEQVISEVSGNGERLYYISADNPARRDVEQETGLYLKDVYHDDSVHMYRNLNFYKTHEEYSYTQLIHTIAGAFFVIIAVVILAVFFAAVFNEFDTVLNLLFSVSIELGLYAVVSYVLIMQNMFTVVYAASVTAAIAAILAGIALMCNRKPHFSTRHSMISAGYAAAVFAIIIIAGQLICGDLYASYRLLGRNQLWALKYIYDSTVPLGIRQNPFVAASMALFGQIFGNSSMLIIIPAAVCGMATVALGVLERVYSYTAARIRKLMPFKTAVYGILSIAAVLVSVLAVNVLADKVDEKKPVAAWENISNYTQAAEPDDAIAIQRSVYSVYNYPIRIITGISTCISASDYDDAMHSLGNKGKNTFYITPEIKDSSYDRVKVIAHKDKLYMYQCYDYLTKNGIYSVNDCVTQGFYESDLGGVAWTSSQNSFIQVHIPYRRYNTVRLYLGNEIKLDEINLDGIDLEFRENWNYVAKGRIDHDNNGKYIDFKLDWTYMVDGYNVIYFHSYAMWSPLIYGDKDTRTVGFPFHYIQFLNLDEQEGQEE